MSDDDNNDNAPKGTGRRTDPNPLPSEPTWDCRRSAEHVGQCLGCRLALDALIDARVRAILAELQSGADTTTNH